MDLTGWKSQLRKGAAELVVLATLEAGELYGVQILEAMTGGTGEIVSDGALYPLLNRLERERKLIARWSLDDGIAHPRKYYRLSTEGARLLVDMRSAWMAFRTAISAIVEKTP
jgi:PadR family transcriptional regulator PadR